MRKILKYVDIAKNQFSAELKRDISNAQYILDDLDLLMQVDIRPLTNKFHFDFHIEGTDVVNIFDKYLQSDIVKALLYSIYENNDLLLLKDIARELLAKMVLINISISELFKFTETRKPFINQLILEKFNLNSNLVIIVKINYHETSQNQYYLLEPKIMDIDSELNSDQAVINNLLFDLFIQLNLEGKK